MTALDNDRLIRALLRQPTDRTPVWLMRQAGRYLPEYRALREKVGGFLAMCEQPEIACEITLQPVLRYPLDAAILFSDILIIPHAMNLGLHFVAGEGPKFAHPVRDEQAITQLPIPQPEVDMPYVCDAVRMIKHELAGRIPLIGFAGSPWTVATYMVEGGSSKNFSTIKRMLYQQPDCLHALLSKITEATVLYLQAQITAGVDVVMLFDTWGGALSSHDYQTFSLHYMQNIISRLQTMVGDKRIPTIIFTKQGGLWLEAMAATGVDALGLDWTIELAVAKARVGDKVALQGNLDPQMLYASPQRIVEQVHHILRQAKGEPGHVFNLGHGILPDIDPEHVAAMIEAVQGYQYK